MTVKEIVWRALLEAEHEQGRRRHPDLGSCAAPLGLPRATVRRALRRPLEMGIVVIRPEGEVSLLDPQRLLLLWAGQRDPVRDLARSITLALPAPEVEHLLPESYLLSGFGAVVAHLGGNAICDYNRVICYGDPSLLPDRLTHPAEAGTILTVLTPDRWLSGPVVSLAQAFVDLFSTPGWPAARFIDHLLDLAWID